MSKDIFAKKTAESSDVSYQNLIDMEDKFIRVDSLVEAGDIIIDAISDLPIFKYYTARGHRARFKIKR